MINNMAKSNLGKNALFHCMTPSWREAKSGTGRRELNQKPWKNSASLSVLHAVQSLSYTTQDRLPRNGTTHSGSFQINC